MRKKRRSAARVWRVKIREHRMEYIICIEVKVSIVKISPGDNTGIVELSSETMLNRGVLYRRAVVYR
jgi:hypothetical protein